MSFKICISDIYKISKSKKSVENIISKGWISSGGSNVKKFEKNFAEYLGIKYAISMSNGTAALINALSIKINKNDYVALPALTFGACANAILALGAKPIFIDTDKNNWIMSLEDLKKKFKKFKFKILINVHLNGYATDIINIKNFCKLNKIFLIEDCAEALGTSFKKKKVGTFGDIGTFSFFANKTITTGEGGMCVTNNKNIATKLRIIRDHGMDPKKKYWHIKKGFNHRLTNIQATVGIEQLKLIHEITRIRKKNFSQYIDFFKNKNYFQKVDCYNHCDPTMWYFPFTLSKNFKNKKKKLLLFLKEKKIETRNFFYPLDQMKIFSSRKYCLESSKISLRSFYLPVYAGLTRKKINIICKTIDVFFN